MPPDSPALLSERFAAGDETAIRELYRHYGGPIQTVARSLVRDPELVAEVVQQTFVKAWRASSSFEPGRELAPWLYSIARRTAIDVLRREGRIADHRATPPADAEAGANQADLAVEGPSFERTWELHELRRALETLPPEERDIVRLSHLVGLSHGEISSRLGVPVGTVKSRSARAHKRLAAALGHLRPENQTASRTVEGKQEPS